MNDRRIWAIAIKGLRRRFLHASHAAWARRGTDNRLMRIRFTKMQGAGNDFIMLDETRGLLGLSPAQYRFLANRQVGVGADQILSVRPSPGEG